MSLIEWVMNLPTRSSEMIMENQSDSDSVAANISLDGKTEDSIVDNEGTRVQVVRSSENKSIDGCSNREDEESSLMQEISSSSFSVFTKDSTQFTLENLIGEGGCSNVYKGSLRRGKLVAVKVLKKYKEAWNDFSLEIDIISSLKHKHIAHLIGVCTEDNHLILVYDFLSKGSLEERLKGHNESILPWKVRFKVAIAVAEALNYLHNGCSHSVIHRDVKSSNILFSDEFQPQLSDFGLATWGPEDAAYMISSDIVGTFGYIAPEYFMHGMISDKIDMYSFGIVLLELLTGKKPISTKGNAFTKNGNLEGLVDPMLDGEFDIVQMQRMVLAATLCIKQSPRLRPKAGQILNLLRVEKDGREWMNCYVKDLQESSYEEMDDLLPELNHKPWLDSSFLVLDDDASSKAEQRHHCRLKDHLKKLQD
ncbi:hypothetical protein GH714_006721 [Hevea brasiliensis]|uniref:Protein kinase domain-containing protein n=1 Tax=Hevea brasiliensis TaxID=3981 RepID=A0A6A6M8Y0_HEVBR|nr:hypothetical protein GH714_006721 [Hevea brasiliensis]